VPNFDYPSGTWKDYNAPILRMDAGGLLIDPATFGMVPRKICSAKREVFTP
jgi:hypothetical protein